MILDILIIILIGLFAVYGLKKGFIISIINIIFLIVYSLFANKYFDLSLSKLALIDIDLNINDTFSKYIIIIIVGLVLMIIIDVIIKFILKVTFLSFFDKIGGLIIHVVIAYLILCFVIIVTNILIPFIDDTPALLLDSYFFSDSFSKFNILEGWINVNEIISKIRIQ